MPTFLLPRQSTAHRIAAIALFRALLTQCRAAPFTQEQRDEFQNVVRNRFKQSQHVHSIRHLRVSFQAGYEAIDYLDAAVNGSEEAANYLSSLLERAPAKVKEAPQAKPTLASMVKVEGIPEESEPGDRKERISLFDRPLPLEKLTGRRHVPVLFNANHIPVLRLKKPQPASLSRFLRQRIEQRQARHNLRFRLYEELQTAYREDEWDELVGEDVIEGPSQSLARAMLGTRVDSNEESQWTDAVEQAIREVHGKLNEERVKNKDMAEKMQAVVDCETELFEKERAERKEAKWAERLRLRNEKMRDAQQEHVHDQEAGENEPMAMAK